MVVYLYECSRCRYVRLNALNVLHIQGPCFNAPHFNNVKISYDPKCCMTTFNNCNKHIKQKCYGSFFLCGPYSEETSFNHPLWSVFQSSYFIQITSYNFIMDLCVQLPCTASYSCLDMWVLFMLFLIMV